MKQLKKKACPNCGEEAAISCRGKRYSIYPAGCLYFLGLPFAILHQLSSPIDFKCESCGEFFGSRTLIGKFALGALVLILLALVIFVIVQIFLRS